MLDIDRGDDIDADGEDFHDILPAFLVPARTRYVCVGKLVDERDPGLSLQHGVEIHLLEPASPVINDLAGDHLKTADQALGQPPPVALDKPDDDVGAPRLPALTLTEHGVRLADARRRAEVDAEVAGLLDHVGGISFRRRGDAHGLVGPLRAGDSRLLANACGLHRHGSLRRYSTPWPCRRLASVRNRRLTHSFR